jgi:PIN domain nuclease of toxin-antitoxin system
MRVLIDTHVFLWFMEGVRLRQNARNFLSDTLNNEIFVSHVTAWEISIKYGIGN